MYAILDVMKFVFSYQNLNHTDYKEAKKKAVLKVVKFIPDNFKNNLRLHCFITISERVKLKARKLFEGKEKKKTRNLLKATVEDLSF